MRLYFLTAVVVVLAAACGQKAKQVATADEAQKVCIEAAGKISQAFQNELGTALRTAMNEGGPAAAIEVCRTKAPQIASAHSRPDYWTIRRVSTNYRNPENRPNQEEQSVLEAFPQLSEQGVAGALSVWRTRGNDSVFAFYVPLYVRELCLNCHGKIENIDAEVIAALKSHYPEDRATGYARGDLRGMIVVEIRWPEARDKIEDVESL